MHDAPRFRALFAHREGRRVLLMSREVWNRMKVHTDQPVLIDIEGTPVGPLARKVDLLAATAARRSEYEVILTVYRDDPVDELDGRVNVDRYRVLEHVRSSLDFTEMVNTASTEDNQNMREFLRDWVLATITIFLIYR